MATSGGGSNNSGPLSLYRLAPVIFFGDGNLNNF